MTHPDTFTRLAAALFGAWVLSSVTSTAAAASATSITIVRVAGAVKVLSADRQVATIQGATLAPPVKIETGADGSIRLEQASSTVDIGPNSKVLLPGPVNDKETVIQSLGRALYSIKARKARTFAVETPYLVSVVKGTVFSVAIEESATSVALLEGSVQLIADGIDPVVLKPNETGRRGAGDRAIAVVPIDVSRPTALRSEAPVSATVAALEPSAPAAISDAMLADLNAVAIVRRDVSNAMATPTPTANPTLPEVEPQPLPPQPEFLPPPPAISPPTPTPTPPPIPTLPPTPSLPEPTPSPDPVYTCRRKKCDSPDDHDNGRGNDGR